MSNETLIIAGLLLVLAVILRRPFSHGRKRHSWFYDAYMKSHLWRLRRWLWYWTSNRRCERCHRRMVLHAKGVRYRFGAPVVTVHHHNYRRLGREHRSDVELLCWPCHSRQDAWRH